MAKERRSFTPAFKKKMVKACFRMGSVADAAAVEDVSHSVVRKWCRDPVFGGELGAFSYEPGSKNGQPPADEGLPTVPQARRRSARALVATRFTCPHCGGPIKEG